MAAEVMRVRNKTQHIRGRQTATHQQKFLPIDELFRKKKSTNKEQAS